MFFICSAVNYTFFARPLGNAPVFFSGTPLSAFFSEFYSRFITGIASSLLETKGPSILTSVLVFTFFEGVKPSYSSESFVLDSSVNSL